MNQDQIPAPSPTPVVGWIGNALRFFGNPVDYMVALRDRFGSVACLVEQQHPPLIIDSPQPKGHTFFGFGAECNRQILTQTEDFQSTPIRHPKTESFNQLSEHILFMHGERHARARRLIGTAFTKTHINHYHDDMIGQTERRIRSWRAGQRIDLLAEMHKLSVDIATQCFFGVEPSASLESLAAKAVAMINLSTFPPAMIPIKLPGSPYSRLCRMADEVVAAIRKEIDQRRAEGATTNDFLSTMVREHGAAGLSDDELVGQTFVLFLVGHDTTACALTWTLFLLAQHPEVAAALLDELDEQLGGDPPAPDQIGKLTVLDRVIKESLRVLCPAVMFPRVAARDTALGGRPVPAGSEIFYSPYVTHIDPDVYTEPKTFDPDRWLSIKPSSFEYLAFGHGRHNCIGAAFGNLELRIILSIILQRFRLQIIPRTKIDLKTVAVMAPKGGLPMRVQPQDRQFASSPGEVRGYIRQMVDLTAA
ncbi:MAG: cytochrome P450 [Acidobacteriota bacterium]